MSNQSKKNNQLNLVTKWRIAFCENGTFLALCRFLAGRAYFTVTFSSALEPCQPRKCLRCNGPVSPYTLIWSFSKGSVKAGCAKVALAPQSRPQAERARFSNPHIPTSAIYLSSH